MHVLKLFAFSRTRRRKILCPALSCMYSLGSDCELERWDQTSLKLVEKLSLGPSYFISLYKNVVPNYAFHPLLWQMKPILPPFRRTLWMITVTHGQNWPHSRIAPMDGHLAIHCINGWNLARTIAAVDGHPVHQSMDDAPPTSAHLDQLMDTWCTNGWMDADHVH
jgi:hypothetical protein